MKTVILIVSLVGIFVWLAAACAYGICRVLRGKSAWGIGAFAVFAFVATLSAQKDGGETTRTGTITYPSNGDASYLADNGSSVEADKVVIDFTRQIAPDTASVYIDRTPLDGSGDWETVLESTFADLELPYELACENATNWNWCVYTDWTPGVIVQTNGIWQAGYARSQPDGKYILPVRSEIEKWREDGLPWDYTPCEYIQSSGTQWIKTGIVAADDIGLYADFMPLNYFDTIVIGQCAATQDGRLSIGSYNSAINLGWNSLYRIDYKPVYREYTASVNFKNDRLITLDGTTILTNLNDFTTATAYEILMFASYWRNTNVNLKGWYRVYRAQISQGEELVRDFIPALDASGTPCMYDRVGRKAYYNSGTGKFGYAIKQ